jgi:hypothetical protein
MRYELPNKSAGYLPEVFSLLKGLDDEHLYGHEHQLSHPSDIFLLTFGDAIACINRLTKSVTNVTRAAELGEALKDDQLSEIRHQVFDLLFYSGNFVEGCLSIVKSLFPRDDKKASKVSKDFRSNVKEYISHASQLINKVKHQHRRPRVFTFGFEDKIVVGYYLEGVVGKGVLGPDPELHKTFHGLRTGFSLNRAIPYHLANLYYVSACLSTVVSAHGRSEATMDKLADDGWLRDALAEAAQVPCLLLPDELDKPLPTVTLKEDERIVLELPGRKEILNRRPHNAQVHLEARVGVRDRGIAPPYMMRN